MAKLVGINYGNRAQGPRGLLDPSIARSLARAQMATEHQLFATAEEFSKSFRRYQPIEADQAFARDVADIEAEVGGRVDPYDWTEVVDLGLTDRAELIRFSEKGGAQREQVPAYEVAPLVLEQRLRKSIEERSKLISDNVEQLAWRARAEEQAIKLVSQAAERGRREAVRHNAEVARGNLEYFQSAGMHDKADETIADMPVAQEFKDLLRAENAQHRELYRITDLARGDDFTAMQQEMATISEGGSSLNQGNAGRALQTLNAGYRRALQDAMKEEGELYYGALRSEESAEIESAIEHLQSDGYTGVLEEAERHTWIARLQSGLKTVGASHQAAISVEVAKSKRNVSRVAEYLTDGRALDPTEINVARAEVDTLRQYDPDAPQVLAFDEALQNYALVTEMRNLSLEDQAERLVSLGSDRTVDGIRQHDQLLKVHRKAQESLATDSMAYAAEMDFYRPEVLPPIDSDGFVGALAARDAADRRIETHFGRSSGPLTAVEAELFSDFQGDPVLLADQVQRAMGERAPLFWEQLVRGNPGSHMVAGEIASRPGGQPDITARRVLAGRAARPNLDWTEGNFRQLRTEATERFGEAFGVDMSMRRAYLSASVDHYIAQMVRRGDQEYLVPSSMGLTIDRSAMEDSVDAVTGGLIRWEGVTLLAPQPGVTSDQFEDWIDELTTEDLPYTRQASREELLERIHNGDIQLRQSRRGRQHFTLYDTFSGTLLSSAGDVQEPAVLSW